MLWWWLRTCSVLLLILYIPFLLLPIEGRYLMRIFVKLKIWKQPPHSTQNNHVKILQIKTTIIKIKCITHHHAFVVLVSLETRKNFILLGTKAQKWSRDVSTSSILSLKLVRSWHARDNPKASETVVFIGQSSSIGHKLPKQSFSLVNLHQTASF